MKDDVALAAAIMIGVIIAGPILFLGKSSSRASTDNPTVTAPAVAANDSRPSEPAATTNTAAVEQSAAAVSLEPPIVYADDLEFATPQMVAASKPAPQPPPQPVARTTYGQQYSACGPNGCAPVQPVGRFRIFGRRR